MFDFNHYVPVVRLRGAELAALRSVTPEDAACVTPLLEWHANAYAAALDERDFGRRLDDSVGGLTSWLGRRVFVDFGIRRPRPHALTLFGQAATRIGLTPVPVVSLKMNLEPYIAEVDRLSQTHGTGLCLRLSPLELSLHTVDQMIQRCLSRFGVPVTAVDLVIDQGQIGCGSGTYDTFVDSVPDLTKWRSLTLLAGSFPADLSGLAPRRVHRLRRHEWSSWEAIAPGTRRPAFGDYMVQHVTPKAAVVAPNFSASIRYTLPDGYLVLRGEGVRNAGSPGYAQWPAWAQLLIEMPEYSGAAFSAGDEYMFHRALDPAHTGSPQTWLQAAFSHHLAMTAAQVTDSLSVRLPGAAMRDNRPAPTPAPSHPEQRTPGV